MLKKIPLRGLVFIICAFAILNIATIRRKDNPILNTQSDAIPWKEKEEEIKGGEKGPPMPSFRIYPRSLFWVQSPNETPEPQELPKAKIPQVGEPIPENLNDLKVEDQKAAENWWEAEADNSKPANEIQEVPVNKLEEEKNQIKPDNIQNNGETTEEEQKDDNWWFEEDTAKH